MRAGCSVHVYLLRLPRCYVYDSWEGGNVSCASVRSTPFFAPLLLLFLIILRFLFVSSSFSLSLSLLVTAMSHTMHHHSNASRLLSPLVDFPFKLFRFNDICRCSSLVTATVKRFIITRMRWPIRNNYALIVNAPPGFFDSYSYSYYALIYFSIVPTFYQWEHRHRWRRDGTVPAQLVSPRPSLQNTCTLSPLAPPLGYYLTTAVTSLQCYAQLYYSSTVTFTVTFAVKLTRTQPKSVDSRSNVHWLYEENENEKTMVTMKELLKTGMTLVGDREGRLLCTWNNERRLRETNLTLAHS